MSIENLESWQLPPRVDVSLVDGAYAERFRKVGETTDAEKAGSDADRLLCELLRKMGLSKTADAYEALDLWRA